jgi:transposase
MRDGDKQSPQKLGAKPRRKPVTEEEKLKLIELFYSGKQYIDIAKELKRPRSVVRDYIIKYQMTGKMETAPRSGRPRKLVKRDIRQMFRAAEHDRLLTAVSIKQQFGWEHVTSRTVQRRMAEHPKFFSTWQTRRNTISERTRLLRLDFCQRYKEWTCEQWRTVLFSDESPFTINSNRRRRCYKKKNEPLHPQCTIPTFKHDAKINVWGCFSFHGVGHLNRIFGNAKGMMDQHIYNGILVDHMLPSAQMLFGDEYLKSFTFQQDNDPKHTAKKSKKWLAEKGVKVLRWPPYSPDLNPIENLWAILKWETRDRWCQTKDELMADLEKTWYRLDKTVLQNLADSMPNRIADCFANNGKWTKY